MEIPEDGVSHHTIWAEHQEGDVKHSGKKKKQREYWKYQGEKGYLKGGKLGKSFKSKIAFCPYNLTCLFKI